MGDCLYSVLSSMVRSSSSCSPGGSEVFGMSVGGGGSVSGCRESSTMLSNSC